jgi:hypothetical protein
MTDHRVDACTNPITQPWLHGANLPVMNRSPDESIMSVCRESGDHGPFNSWDRIPFLHDLGPDRTPSAIPLTSLIQGNFLVANYQALAAVDTDDGSQLFDVNSNFLVYGFTGQKAFFNGQDLNHTGDAQCF